MSQTKQEFKCKKCQADIESISKWVSAFEVQVIHTCPKCKASIQIKGRLN